MDWEGAWDLCGNTEIVLQGYPKQGWAEGAPHICSNELDPQDQDPQADQNPPPKNDKKMERYSGDHCAFMLCLSAGEPP